MMIEVAAEEKERWNNIVRSFDNYDVFYLNEYVTAFMKENESNGIPVLLYYANGTDRALNVIFKRDISKDQHFRGEIEQEHFFDLITPYGYGGFWGRIEDYDSLNHTYNEYCQSRNYVCEFVRFELFNNYFENYDGTVETRTHNVVRNLEMPLEYIWMDFKQKVRKNVQRANKNGLEIIIENTGEYLDEFLKIYYGTMERNDAEKNFYFSRSFFETLNCMAENIMYFHVVHENMFISTELVIFGAENAYSYLGGTDRNYFDLRPNDFLKYEIIKWAKEKGLKNFVLGGGYGSDDGIFQYKTSLAPNGVKDFYIGRKIFDKAAYDHLCELRGVNSHSMELREAGFFPEYRGGHK